MNEENENNSDPDILEGENQGNSGIYPEAKIKIDKDQFSLFELKRRFDNKERQDIIIDPEFQRNSVWDNRQKCELIESILMGIPLPVIYLFEQKDGKKQVVDGRQRLTTIFDYINNEFTLTNLKILHDENTKKFEKLKPLYQGKIEDFQLQAYIIQPPTPERVKYDIFDRVNRGGTRLTNQEMRNALYQGKSTVLLKELAESTEFKNATGKAISDKRMKGRYIILRALSFYILQKKWFENSDFKDLVYKSDIDDFLAKTMSFINDLSDDKIEYLQKIFLQAMKNSYKTLGADGFRFDKKGNKNVKRPINMALFEALTYLFLDDNIDYSNNDLIKNKIDALKTEFDESNFSNQIDSSTKVNYRFSRINELIKELNNA